MNVNGKHYRTIWINPNDPKTVQIIDQNKLPYDFVIEDLKNVEDVVHAIKDMHVRGAGLIGATAGYGMYLAALQNKDSNDFDFYMGFCGEQLKRSRPTAVNLAWAVDRQLDTISKGKSLEEKVEIAYKTADDIANEDAEYCRLIGINGLPLIEKISKKNGGDTVNILTHCNAGWLAFTDHGSALAPIYAAFDKRIPVHVWVDETRPRNQGAKLTAWELGQHGVSHTIIADNAGGYLMEHGDVDLVIVGADRVTCTGDVANKIGTLLKATTANYFKIPFYVALPSSTFDWTMISGMQIPIELRSGTELIFMEGYCDKDKAIKEVRVVSKESEVLNPAFDVTPRDLVTGLITERGICKANVEDILRLYPEHEE